jgi:P4 family phage/plasmid primase-like protien
MDFVKSTALWKFMVDIANGDESLAYTLLVIIASSLIIQTKKRMFYIWKGSGNNGKSTLVKLLELTLEPIFGYIPVNALLIKDVKNSEEAPRPFLLSMKDKRLGVTSELKEQAELDSNIIKMITGSDTIPVRNLFDRRPTYVQPYFNLFMTTNPMPRINDKSLAMKDRFVVIEFTRRFEGEEVDKYILEKLLSNVDEIYLVLLEMLKVHLTKDVENVVKQCKAIMDTTKRYWYEQDGVQWYLDEYAVDTKDKENDIVYVSEVEDNIETFYKEVLKKTPPSRETIRRLLRLKIPDDRFDYDIKKHRSLVLKGYKFRPLAVWRNGDEDNNDNNNKKNNNRDDNNASNGSKNNNKNSSNNSGNNIVTTTAETVEPSEPTSAESNKKHVEDNDKDKDRDTLDKILFALFSEENGGYFRCPLCNDSVRYTSPYTLSQHVCYAHARNYGTFNADGMTVKVQEFIRLLQKFYPITEDHGWTYFIRKLSNSSPNGNRNAV